MPVLNNIKQHKLLLDTHIWIWLMFADHRLSKVFQNTVQQNVDKDALLISAMSVWELGMLTERKKIDLYMDCLDWVEHSLETRGMHLVPLTPRIAIQSSRLPGNPHGDPADRILIATAHEHNAVLVTHDRKILDYGKGKFITVHDPVARF